VREVVDECVPFEIFGEEIEGRLGSIVERL
jgi:hypothetical protein